MGIEESAAWRGKQPVYSEAEASERWRQEDNLINHRMTWLGITQGLLFTGYAATFQLTDAPWHSKENYDLFLRLLPSAGIWISIFVFIGICAAFCAMIIIYRRSPMKHFGVKWYTTVIGWACAACIPLVFIFVWLKLLKSTLGGFIVNSAQAALELVL